MRTLLLASLGIVALSSCVQEKESSSDNTNTEVRLSAELDDNVMSAVNREEFQQWESERHADPLTGEIPRGMRQAELAFAKKLPHRMERALSWQKRGPVNMGGRTRAWHSSARTGSLGVIATEPSEQDEHSEKSSATIVG